MAELVTVARPYAEAAYRLALESGTLPHWSDMLQLIEAVVRDEQVAARIGDPKVDAQALQGVILGAVGDRLDGHGRNLVQVLVQNGRLDLVSHIRSSFEALRRQHEGVLEATIISALPMSDVEMKPLLSALETKFGRKVNAQIKIDPELIGGARIVIGDKMIDATVRGRLDAMAAALAR